ncbi:sodium-dependent multivitamin transporter-like [Mizuhopecten yessoensis]|uniref:sodium-dependent multivitamin transporter-like n=1 Tax=Mizuhopecten yessoensis TaxID=6573 RepID=UPI000B45C8C0|nr:sodium-dependent multivitamin transporter-like [Mizuhopecten yessoensis]
MLVPWANQKGAITGMLTSLTFMLWISVGYQINKPKVTTLSVTDVTGCNWNLTTTAASILTTTVSGVTVTTTEVPPTDTSTDLLMRLYSLSYLWYSATAMLVTVGMGIIVSLITGRTDPKSLDPRLICPIFDVFLPFLPERWRRRLWFGVRHDEVKDDKPVNDIELAVNGNRTKHGKSGMYQKDTGITNQAYSTSDDDKKARPPFTHL